MPTHWRPLLNLASRVLVPSCAIRALFEESGVIVPVRAATDAASLLAGLDD